MEVCNKFVSLLLRLFKSNFFNIKTLCHFKVLLKYFTCPPPLFSLIFLGCPPRKPFFSHAPPPPLKSHQPHSLVKNERSLRIADKKNGHVFFSCDYAYANAYVAVISSENNIRKQVCLFFLCWCCLCLCCCYPN